MRSTALLVAPALLAAFAATQAAGADGSHLATQSRTASKSAPSGGFSGLYLGAGGGGVRGDGDLEASTSGGTVFSSHDFSNGTAYGAVAGYNLQRGRFVYGGEVRHLFMDDFSQTTLEMGEVTDLRGRIGLVAGQALIYGAAGWSWGTLENTATGAEGDLEGASFGVGVEYNLGGRFFAGADVSARRLSGGLGTDAEADIDVNSATLQIGLRF